LTSSPVPGDQVTGHQAPAGQGSGRGRRRPGRLAPVVGTARKMLQDALAAAGYPERVLVACSGGPDSPALAANGGGYLNEVSPLTGRGEV